MNKIVNGVANDYEFPDLDWVHHDSKTFKPPISSYGSVDLNELQEVMERLKKVPNYDDLIKDNNKKDKQITQLTNNWNELEEWCKNNLGYYGEEGIVYKYVLDKMKEVKEKKNE